MSEEDLGRILAEIRADLHILSSEYLSISKFHATALERERWLQHQIDVMAGRLAALENRL